MYGINKDAGIQITSTAHLGIHTWGRWGTSRTWKIYWCYFQGMPEPVAYLGRIQDMNIKHGQSELYGVM